MIYKCTNYTCELFNKRVKENIHLVFSNKGIIDKKISCPECGDKRELMYEDNGMCKTTLGRPNVPTK